MNRTKIKKSLIYLLNCIAIPFMIFTGYSIFADLFFIPISYELWYKTCIPITIIISIPIFTNKMYNEYRKKKVKINEN